jgi:GT2 family glycosyltransferase
MVRTTADVKERATREAKARLQEFFESNTTLNLPRFSRPRVSILLVLYNRAELTLACLRSLLPHLEAAAAEVVLVDNASRDETAKLLPRICGAKVICNRDNRGYAAGVNRAAEAAAGDYLLLLNNDTQLLGDSLNAAARFLSAHNEVAAVGGRIILLDGTLQEAGCTVWREGDVFQYGRGDCPTAPQYLFQRDVDHCSGAFLMTRRAAFEKMGGLDRAFGLGYFEDLDYCVRLWRAGWRVVYLPDVAVLHYENASSGNPERVLDLYRRNHLYFTRKHADWLAWQCPAFTSPLLARGSHDDRFRILYLPKRESRTMAEVVRRVRRPNAFVTVYPIGQPAIHPRAEFPEFPADAEVLCGGPVETLPDLLAQRRHYYDCVLASDTEIVAWVRRCLETTATAA